MKLRFMLVVGKYLKINTICEIAAKVNCPVYGKIWNKIMKF